MMGDAEVSVIIKCIIDNGFGSEVEYEGLLGILSLARYEGGRKVGNDFQCNITSTLDVFGNPEDLEVDLVSIQGVGVLGIFGRGGKSSSGSFQMLVEPSSLMSQSESVEEGGEVLQPYWTCWLCLNG
jgi:hypothetical protein